MKNDSWTKGMYEKYPNPEDAIEHISLQVDILTIMEYMGGQGSEKEIGEMAAVLTKLREISTK